MKPGKQLIGLNFAVLSIGQVGSRLLGFVTTVHIAHALLPDSFGSVVYAMSVLLYAALLVDFGFDNFGPIEVSRGTSDVRTLASNVLTWRTIMALPAFGAISLFAALAPVSPLSKLLIVLYGLSLFTNPFDLGWVFLGSRNMLPSALAEIITQLTLVLGALLVVQSPADASKMPFVYLLGRVLAVAFVFVSFVRQYGLPKLGIDWSYFKRILGSSIPLSGSQLMGMISNNFDIIVIGILLNSAGAGLYGAAMRVVWMPTVVAVSYYMALRPLLAHSYVEGFATVETLFKRSVKITTALAFGVGVGGCLVARDLLIQLYGPGYDQAVTAFQILLASFSLLLVSRNYRLLLVTFNHQVTDLKVMSTAAAVNVGFNLALIKPFGISGAACATLISETVILIATYTLTRKLISHVPLGRYIIRPVLCSGAMAALLLSLPALNVFVRVALGAGAYLALLVVTRVVTVEEIKGFIGAFASRGKPALPPASAAIADEQLLPAAGSKRS